MEKWLNKTDFLEISENDSNILFTMMIGEILRVNVRFLLKCSAWLLKTPKIRKKQSFAGNNRFRKIHTAPPIVLSNKLSNSKIKTKIGFSLDESKFEFGGEKLLENAQKCQMTKTFLWQPTVLKLKPGKLRLNSTKIKKTFKTSRTKKTTLKMKVLSRLSNRKQS